MNFRTRQLNFVEILFLVNFIVYYFLFITKSVPWNYAMFALVATTYILKNKFRIHSREVAFIVIIVVTAASLIYSGNKMEGFQKVVALVVFYFGIYKYLFNKINIIYINNVINTGSIISIVYIAICFLTFGEYLERGIYIGTTLNQHNSAILIAISFLFIFVYIYYTSNNFLKLLLFFLLIYILFLSISSYARVSFIMIGSFFLIVLLYKFILTNKKLYYIILVTLLLTCFVYIFYDLLIYQFNDVYVYIQDKGLSGRDTIIYRLLNNLLEEYIYFLSGFGVGSIDTKIEGITPRDAGSFFVVLYEGGLILLMAWGIFIFRYFYLLFKIYKIKYLANYIKLFLAVPVAMILNIADAVWVQYSTFDTVIMFIGIIMTEKIYFLEKKKI
jgi:hypothetical protein